MSDHWQALGWTLVHFLWQGAAIALVYRIADASLARSRASLRYVLALAALLCMLVVSLATLAWEETSSVQTNLLAPASLQAAAMPPSAPLVLAADPSAPDVLSGHHSFRLPLGVVLPSLDAVWFAGVLALSLRGFGGWWLIRRLRLSPLQLAPHPLRLRLDALRHQLGVHRLVELRLSSRITNPLTAGIFRPWILLPIVALTSLSAEQIEVILTHELAHIRRADYFWNLLQTVVETLFFFHPAVWWISRRAREERELCCDDIAVASCNDAAVYAGALLRLEEARKNHLRFAMALDGHQSRAGLRARILRLLGDAEAKPRSLRPASVAGIAAAVILICPLPKVFASFRAVPKAAELFMPGLPPTAPAAITSVIATTTPRSISPVELPEATPSQPNPAAQAAPAPSAQTPAPAHPHSDYIDRMRAAGYDVDLDKYIAMKVQGITPDYAAEMSKAAGGKLSADDLIAMKVQGFTPDYMSSMRAAGYDADTHKLLAMKVQGITPDYAAEMSKAAGSKLSANDLIAMKVQGFTPDYMSSMRAAGYDADTHKLLAMKVQGITPDYAAQMSKATGSKLSADDLIAMKVQGFTPDYMSSMRAAGYDADTHKLLAMKVQGITPEYADAMAKLGFGKPDANQLIALKVQGVTPDYAAKVRASGIEVSGFGDLISDRIFNVSPEFIAGMKAAGFPAIPPKQLLTLRVQGVTPEFATQVKKQFPDVTVNELVQLRVFNINADFIASAERHGFAPLTIQKLVKLRVSGILDDDKESNR